MRIILLYLLPGLFLISCAENENADSSVIPQPVSFQTSKGSFNFSSKTSIHYAKSNDSLSRIVNLFMDNLDKRLGIQPETVRSSPLHNQLIINVDFSLDLPDEGYLYRINRRKIYLDASSFAGIFYGLQSLSQLIQVNINEEGTARIPLSLIKDYPRFSYRGMHLDVCRHFMPVEDVKKYLDYLALYKFNRFHWHLTEDQGWRIEIKQYPELTRTGACRDQTLVGHLGDSVRKYDGEKYCGFYTQEEIREVVQYAADRFITVVPEIEMPGHAQSAIASYPWLGVTGENPGVKEEWGISPWIFKPSEETFTFLENVLSEVIELFPSEYIHIGGDEAIKEQWKESAFVQNKIKELELKDEHELQSWFIQRIEKFLNSKGRKIIGWDEILEGGLAPNAAVMSWRGEEGGIKAARMGHYAVMTPTSHCYFDFYQADPETEPLAIGGFTPIMKVYNYDPVPDELGPEEAKYILGAQANVWTEYISDFERVEYMIFPRMLAMSEVTWTQTANKSEDLFRGKVLSHKKIFEDLDINYSKTGMPDQ